MKIVYFLATAFVISSCSSTKKIDSIKSNLKDQKGSIQDSNVIKTVQSEMSRVNTLLNKKTY